MSNLSKLEPQPKRREPPIVAGRVPPHDLDAEAYERFRHHDLSVDWNLSVRPPIDRRDD